VAKHLDSVQVISKGEGREEIKGKKQTKKTAQAAGIFYFILSYLGICSVRTGVGTLVAWDFVKIACGLGMEIWECLAAIIFYDKVKNLNSVPLKIYPYL